MRRQKQVSQAATAEVLGISPSYLNPIEHNRRKVTVPLLFKAASYFGVAPGALVDSGEPRLASDLVESFDTDVFLDCSERAQARTDHRFVVDETLRFDNVYASPPGSQVRDQATARGASRSGGTRVEPP